VVIGELNALETTLAMSGGRRPFCSRAQKKRSMS